MPMPAHAAGRHAELVAPAADDYGAAKYHDRARRAARPREEKAACFLSRSFPQCLILRGDMAPRVRVDIDDWRQLLFARFAASATIYGRKVDFRHARRCRPR